MLATAHTDISQLTLMLSTNAMLATAHTDSCEFKCCAGRFKCRAGNGTHRFMLSTSAMLAMTHADSPHS